MPRLGEVPRRVGLDRAAIVRRVVPRVLGPWIAEDEDLFVWILGHDGDWEAEDSRYYSSDERRAIDPDPARHLAEARHTLMRAPAPARAREP